VIAGILELNGLFLVGGISLLAGLRGWGTWLELVEELGLAFMLGVSSVCVLATLALVAGAGLSTLTILLLVLIDVAVGVALCAWRDRPLPRRFGRLPRRSRGTVAAIVAAAASIAILVAMLRLAWVAPMGGGDSFEFWVPKAKVIYFFGTIDTTKFTSLTSPRYPLLVPALLAMDFRFMGSAYGPELGLQYWFLFCGFTLGAATLLRRIVPAWLSWGFIALAGTIPELDTRMLNAQADWALDVFYGLAAITAIVWLRRREPWLLGVYATFTAATIATKQEGLLIIGCFVLGLLAATVRRWRLVWPQLICATLVGYAANLPWRIWWGIRDLPVTLPTMGINGLADHIGRVWPSLWLVLRLTFAYEHWLAFVPLAILAALVAITGRGQSRETAVTYLVATVALFAGFTYILWDDVTYVLDEHQSSTPVPRAVGSIVILATVFAPILIDCLLHDESEVGRASA
jgi:branched-subunit amino acid transport protein